MDWTLLFEEHIDNIGISLDVFAVFRFGDFLLFEFFWPSVYSGGVSRGCAEFFVSVYHNMAHA